MSQFRSNMFPFCVVDVESTQVGAGTLWPVGVSLDKAMEWYWRVKYWTLEAISTSAGTVTISGIQFFDVAGAATNERDLVCLGALGDETYQATDHAGIHFQNFLVSADGAPDDAIAAAQPPDWADFDEMRAYGGLYYPLLLFRWDNDYDSGNFSTWYDPPGYTLATFPVNFDGNLIPLYTSDEVDWISCDFFPSEWWPYAPTSGGSAIFDIANGSQINPNVVID